MNRGMYAVDRQAENWRAWDRLKNKVGHCRPRRDIFGFLASFFGGLFLAGIGLIANSTQSKANDSWLIFSWVLTTSSVLALALCYFARDKVKEADTQTIDSVLDEMRHLESDWQRPPSS